MGKSHGERNYLAAKLLNKKRQQRKRARNNQFAKTNVDMGGPKSPSNQPIDNFQWRDTQRVQYLKPMVVPSFKWSAYKRRKVSHPNVPKPDAKHFIFAKLPGSVAISSLQK